MGISNYYKERNILFARLERERRQLLTAGVSEADIFKAHFVGKDSDYGVWKADRVFGIHNSVSASELSDDTLSIFRSRFEVTNSDEPRVGDWFDQIGNPKLLAALISLTAAEFAMVEACWVNGVPQKVYAKSIGRTQCYVSKRLSKLKDRFKSYF
jgi:hypothetical protein